MKKKPINNLLIFYYRLGLCMDMEILKQRKFLKKIYL